MKRGYKIIKKLLRWEFIIILVIGWLIVGAYRWSNTDVAQRKILNWVNSLFSWKIESAAWRWDFWGRTFEIKNLSLTHSRTGNKIRIGQANFTYKPFSTLRGRVNIQNLIVSDVSLDFSNKSSVGGAPKRLKLSRLLLMRRFEIEKSNINHATIKLPKGKELEADNIKLSFIPAYFGEIDLNLGLSNIIYRQGEKEIASIGEFTLSGETDINKWYSEPPFINAIHGNLKLSDLKHPKLTIKGLETAIIYKDNDFKLDSLKAAIGESEVLVKGDIDIENKKYDVLVEIPKPVAAPSFGAETKFFDTQGTISGRIKLKGSGLEPESLNGKLSADLKHTPTGPAGARLIPVDAHIEAEWSKGVARFDNSYLKVKDKDIPIKGSLDLPRKHASIDFSGSNIPLEFFFGRFTNPYFHPIFGPATFRGSFNGWAKAFTFDLSGDVSNGGYYEIVSEHTHVDFSVNYNELNLNGQLIQGGRTTGEANLKIRYGARLEDGTRAKQFTLNARLNQHNLDPSMAAYKLGGIATGEITMSGTPYIFKGTSTAQITNGDLSGLKFKLAKSQLTLVPKKMTYQNSVIQLEGLPETDLPNTIYMDFTAGGFRLYGTPRQEVSFDSFYNTSGRQWQIKKITYTSPLHRDMTVSAAGTYSSGGILNLQIHGMLDFGLLEYLKMHVREANGAADLNLRVGGSISSPSVYGQAVLIGSSIHPRGYAYDLENLRGTIKFDGNSILLGGVNGSISDGRFKLDGSARHANWGITGYNIKLDGDSLMFATQDRTFKMEFDCHVGWVKTATGSRLDGEVNIIDAKYTKDFNIIESIGRGSSAAAEREAIAETEGWENVQLNLLLKNAGDILIQNNIGKIWLRTDITLKGTRAHPQMSGAIEVVDGKIRYLGMDYEITKGAIEFRAPFGRPYIDVAAEREFPNYNIVITLRGDMDRIKLDLASNPPLDRNDIVSLLTSGMTTEEAREAKIASQIGAGMAVEQVSQVLARPITEMAHLDIFRIESAAEGKSGASRLYIGKQLSDRLSLEFVTDIYTANAQQTVQAEYLITDFLLLKGSTSRGLRNSVTIALRFRER